jgi:hypothetical protein
MTIYLMLKLWDNRKAVFSIACKTDYRVCFCCQYFIEIKQEIKTL